MRVPRELSGRDRPRRERLTRRLPLWLAGATAAALGVAALIGAAAGYGRLLSSLRSADPAWLAVALLFEVLAYLGYALAFRTSAALGGGPRLGLARAVRLVLASVGATRLMLGGGPAYLYWTLRGCGLGRAGALGRLAALNALLFGLLAGGAWVAALVVLAGSGDDSRTLALPWLIGVAAVAGACAVAYAFLRRTARVVALTKLLLPRPSAYLDAYVGAVLYWVGDILCLWSALQAFGTTLGGPELLLAYASAYLATMLPLPLGGAGGGEAAVALTLSAVGVPLAPALLGALGYRLVSFWLPTPAGIALLATEPTGRLPREATPGSFGRSSDDRPQPPRQARNVEAKLHVVDAWNVPPPLHSGAALPPGTDSAELREERCGPGCEERSAAAGRSEVPADPGEPPVQSESVGDVEHDALGFGPNLAHLAYGDDREAVAEQTAADDEIVGASSRERKCTSETTPRWPAGSSTLKPSHRVSQ